MDYWGRVAENLTILQGQIFLFANSVTKHRDDCTPEELATFWINSLVSYSPFLFISLNHFLSSNLKFHYFCLQTLTNVPILRQFVTTIAPIRRAVTIAPVGWDMNWMQTNQHVQVREETGGFEFGLVKIVLVYIIVCIWMIQYQSSNMSRYTPCKENRQ